MEDFAPYELAVKLKEKGFTCKYPFAMYTEYEQFCPLYTSDRYYFGIDDFDKHDCIAPTISQVLKWLREEKKIFIRVTLSYHYSTDTDGEEVDRWTFWLFEVFSVGSGSLIYTEEISEYDSYELAAIAGIEYVLDNLI